MYATSPNENKGIIATQKVQSGARNQVQVSNQESTSSIVSLREFSYIWSFRKPDCYRFERQGMEQLAEITRLRGGHRASVTKLVTKASQFTEGEVTDLAKVISLRKKLEGKRDLLLDLDEKVLSLLGDGDDIEAEIETADSKNLELEQIIEKLVQDESRLGGARLSLDSKGGQIPGSTSVGSSVGRSFSRLPKLSLNKFNGDPKGYEQFIQQYESAIGTADLSNVEKFCYLKSLLGGNAARAIEGLTVNENNYNSALEILKQRFGDRQVVINAHMNEFMGLDPVKNPSDVRRLRILHDRTTAAIRSLEGLGVTQEMFGALLVPILLNKIPEDMRVLINRAVTTKNVNWTVQELLFELHAEISARERSEQGLERSLSTPNGPGKKGGKMEP